MPKCSVAIALLLLIGSFRLAAQSAQAVPLELQSDPVLEDGQVAIVGGAAGAEGVRYVLPKLSIRQPVAVTLLSREASPTLELSLHAPGWKDTARRATLDGEAWRTLKFRTQGDVGITVRSPDGRRQTFDLVAWVGSEIEPEMEEVVVSPEEYRRHVAARPDLYPSDRPPGTAGGGTSPVLLVIAAALLGIFVLLGVLVFRQVRS